MNRHSIAILMQGVCPILDVNPEQAMREVDWPASTHVGPDMNVSGANFVMLWNTIIRLAADKADPLFLGRTMANGPMFPIFLAFSTAPNLRVAVRRLARYKSLFGPVALNLKSQGSRLRMEITADEPTLRLPPSLTLPIGIFVVEKARSHTALEIVPTNVSIPRGIMKPENARRYFGASSNSGPNVVIEFSAADLRAPFLSMNDALWLELEQDLERQLTERIEGVAFHNQVETAIRKALNTGPARVDAICEEMGVSRSTLQRRLKEEGLSYQAILNRVRMELAIRYLTKSILMPASIAGLVGFADSKSFHRAFKRWTNKTPEQFRRDTKQDGWSTAGSRQV